jgi:hypothetical protein
VGVAYNNRYNRNKISVQKKKQNTYSDCKEDCKAAERIKTGMPNKPEEHAINETSSNLSMKSK